MALLSNHVPLVPPGQLRSGVAVSADGLQLTSCIAVFDGGADRPGVIAAWFTLAVEVLRAGGINVVVSLDGLSARLAPASEAA